MHDKACLLTSTSSTFHRFDPPWRMSVQAFDHDDDDDIDMIIEADDDVMKASMTINNRRDDGKGGEKRACMRMGSGVRVDSPPLKRDDLLTCPN